jgi:CO/xanthine dehydrogenase FAD-binding subunit
VTRYAKPRTVDEALALLGEDAWRVLAGGTDFYPGLGNRPLAEDVLDISGIGALRGIDTDDDFITIGAGTCWTDIVRHDLPPAFDALRQAAREVGSIQIQNAGTIGGNLCNASPAADGVPALMVLDACVELRSRERTRRLALGDFILGNRRTALAPDEMLVSVLVPRRSAYGRSAFVKLGARRYLVISIAMAAARLVVDGAGRVSEAAVAVGACSAVAQRLGALEQALIGRVADRSIAEAVEARHVDGLSPIDDVRASSEYRVAAAREIVGRALVAALDPAATTGAAA